MTFGGGSGIKSAPAVQEVVVEEAESKSAPVVEEVVMEEADSKKCSGG